jgi:hypothetical protein
MISNNRGAASVGFVSPVPCCQRTISQCVHKIAITPRRTALGQIGKSLCSWRVANSSFSQHHRPSRKWMSWRPSSRSRCSNGSRASGGPDTGFQPSRTGSLERNVKRHSEDRHGRKVHALSEVRCAWVASTNAANPAASYGSACALMSLSGAAILVKSWFRVDQAQLGIGEAHRRVERPAKPKQAPLDRHHSKSRCLNRRPGAASMRRCPSGSPA